MDSRPLAPDGSARVPAPSCSVASFNAHYGRDRYDQPFDVLGACRSFDADVIALQEVWWPDDQSGWLDDLRSLGYQLAELPLARAGGSPTLDIQRVPGHSTGSWGIAIASRLPVLASGTVGIGRTPFDPAGERSALRIDVDLGQGERLSVTTVHATHYVPLAPLHHIRLAKRLGRPERSVVLGDFNMWGPPAGWTFRGWKRPVRGRSYPAHRPHSQIDHLFASPDLVVGDAEVMGDVGSDHRPIRARVGVLPAASTKATCRSTLSTS